MYESILESKLERYRKNYRIEAVYASCEENTRKISTLGKKKSPYFFYHGVLKRNEAGPGLTENIFFSMYIKNSNNVLKIIDIEPMNLVKRCSRLKEVFFYILVEQLKRRGICLYKAERIIMCSKDFFIQEALLANGFDLHNKNSDKEDIKYMGIWKKSKKEKIKNEE